MDKSRLLQLGGYCAFTFVGVWIVCSAIYLLKAGIPAVASILDATAALMRRPAYRLAFWLWLLAFLAVIVTALAAHEYLRFRSPGPPYRIAIETNRYFSEPAAEGRFSSGATRAPDD